MAMGQDLAAGRVYRGARVRGIGPLVTVDFRPLRHVIFHSPTGFSWGYGGSGPADLALSILGDHLDCAEALQRYVRSSSITTEREVLKEHPAVLAAFTAHQPFKFHFLTRLPMTEPWAITGFEIASWLKEHPL